MGKLNFYNMKSLRSRDWSLALFFLIGLVLLVSGCFLTYGFFSRQVTLKIDLAQNDLDNVAIQIIIGEKNDNLVDDIIKLTDSFLYQYQHKKIKQVNQKSKKLSFFLKVLFEESETPNLFKYFIYYNIYINLNEFQNCLNEISMEEVD